MPGAAPASYEHRLVIRIWNFMDGSIDWSALPVLVNLYGIDDPEILIEQLQAIREHMRRQERNG